MERAAARKVAPSGHHLDRSGKTRKGKASYYGRRFHGKTMANGETMKPDSNAAASKTQADQRAMNIFGSSGLMSFLSNVGR